jgi:hypothetical protein
LDTSEASPFSRNAAFVRALISKNLAEFDKMHVALCAALASNMSENAVDLKAASSCVDYLFNNLQVQVQSKRFHRLCRDWAMSPHHDGSAGMILLAWQLVGARKLVLLSKEGNEHSVQCKAGHLYVANASTAYHQVRHSFAGESVALGSLGECEVAFVARCSFLGKHKARGCNGLHGRSFFKPMEEALQQFLKETQLELPSLAEVHQNWVEKTRFRVNGKGKRQRLDDQSAA